MPPLETVDAGPVRLLLRPAVAARELRGAFGPAFYLSLYDGELDERADRVSAALPAGPLDDAAALGARVEPTDALIATSAGGAVAIARGGCCTFPLYWRRAGRQLEVTTGLPVFAEPTLSVEGLVKAAAAVNFCSSYEPNAWCETPLAGWRRLRRGVVTVIGADGDAHETPVLHGDTGDVTADAAASAVRDALAAYGTSQRRIVTSLVEASGGLEARRSIETLVMTGSARLPAMGMVVPVTIHQKRPDRMHVEANVQEMGMKVVTGYDGETGWTLNPMMGRRPMRLIGVELQNAREQADLDGLLVDAEAKGYRLSYAGDDSLRGRPVQKLRLLRADSTDMVFYLDAETHLTLAVETDSVNPIEGGRKVRSQTFFRDYRDVNGVKLPFEMEVVMGGQTFQVVSFKEMKANEPVDDALFAMPEQTN